MKTSLVVSILLISASIFSQANKLYVKKVSVGVMLPIVATANLPLQDKPFNMGYSLSPSVNMLTSKTHHHLMYDAGTNSIQTFSGYLLPNDIDAYFFFSKNLNSQNKYLGVGIEKVFPVNNNLIFILWGEIGSNLQGNSSVSFGVTIHPQISLWQRK